MSFGNGDVLAKIDGVADLTIVHPECVPTSVYCSTQGNLGMRTINVMLN